MTLKWEFQWGHIDSSRDESHVLTQQYESTITNQSSKHKAVDTRNEDESWETNFEQVVSFAQSLLRESKPLQSTNDSNEALFQDLHDLLFQGGKKLL